LFCPDLHDTSERCSSPPNFPKHHHPSTPGFAPKLPVTNSFNHHNLTLVLLHTHPSSTLSTSLTIKASRRHIRVMAWNNENAGKTFFSLSSRLLGGIDMHEFGLTNSTGASDWNAGGGGAAGFDDGFSGPAGDGFGPPANDGFELTGGDGFGGNDGFGGDGDFAAEGGAAGAGACRNCVSVIWAKSISSAD
jgi:hypothetical protein